MEVYETILTKLDIRKFSSRKIPGELILKILEAARSTGNVFNAQDWKFILVQDIGRLVQLSKDSARGQWVEDAPLAIMVLTNPRQHSGLDGGRESCAEHATRRLELWRGLRSIHNTEKRTR